MGFPLYDICCFYLAIFNIVSLCLISVSLISTCLDVFLLEFILSAHLGLDYFLSHAGDIFNYNLFKNFLIHFVLLCSGTPVIWMSVCLILFQKSLRLSSVLFIHFNLFCSSEVISTKLSSSSLICSSASDILLLISSRVFFISVIVLSLYVYSLILLDLVNWFKHFLHYVFKVFDHLYYHYSEFFFR